MLKLVGIPVTAFIVCALVGPVLIPYLHKLKFGQSIRECGPASHMKKSGTPTMGGLMMLAAQNVLNNGGAGVSPFWLVGSILMLTLGELCLSPIGLATMTLLAPERMRGQMMGLWFCASALGNLAAGLIGGHVKADQLDMLPDLFARCSIALLICAAVLFVLIVPVRRMLENAQTKPATEA